jgi:hypothetical protein
LLWDEADPKRSEFTFSIDNGKTFSRVAIDWSRVTFKKNPLLNVEWKNVSTGVVRTYVNGGLVNTIAVNKKSATDYEATTKIRSWLETSTVQPGSSIVEGLSPVFYPLNPTEIKLYVEGSHPAYKVSFNDRVRIEAKKGGGTVTNDTSCKIIAECYDPDNPAVPLLITLHLKVTVM